MKQLIAFCVGLSALPVLAELKPLDDAALDAVSGQGLGIILDNISVTSQDDASYTVTSGDSVITYDHIQLTGSAADGSIGATIGTLDDPITLDVETRTVLGETNQVIHIALPSSFGEAGETDFRTRIGLDSDGSSEESVWLSSLNRRFDGTFTDVWGDPEQGFFFATFYNFHADSISLQTQTISTVVDGQVQVSAGVSPLGELLLTGCGAGGCQDLVTTTNDGGATYEYVVAGTQDIDGVNITLPFGSALSQGITFTALDDGNLEFELAPVTAETAALFNAQPSGRIEIGEVRLGGTSFGHSVVNDIKIQHFKFTTRNIN